MDKSTTKLVKIKEEYYVVDKISAFSYQAGYSPRAARLSIRLTGDNEMQEFWFDKRDRNAMGNYEKVVRTLFEAFGVKILGSWKDWEA